MLDIADDMRLRLQNDFSPLNRALNTPVDNHSLGFDSPPDMSFPRDKERSAVQFPVDLPIDLNQALCGNTTYNLQSFGNYISPKGAHMLGQAQQFAIGLATYLA